MAPNVQDGGMPRSMPVHRASLHKKELRARRPPPKVIIKTKEALTKQASHIAKKADEHEHFINKVTYCVGVVAFGIFCYLLGSRPHDIPYLYCAFFLTATPLRWIYYRSKKWHYFLLDFCYYANLIFTAHLLFIPRSEKLFLLCFAFAEGPLAWALIVWRCSLVFSSIDKIVSVLIHLLPGTVIFIIRWWDPATFTHHSVEDTGPWPAWPLVPPGPELWVWMFVVPLAAYSLWQALYWVIVEGLRKQRFLNDPEVLTSYRELSRKAARANNMWWRLSGLLGDSNRVVMYAVLQALFTVATMGLTVPMFLSYRLHGFFQLFKIAASIWNGGNFFFDVMPRQVHAKAEKRKAATTKELTAELAQAPPQSPSAGLSPIPASAPPLEAGAGDLPGQGENFLKEPKWAPHDGALPLCASCRRASASNLLDFMEPSFSPELGAMRSKSLGQLPEPDSVESLDVLLEDGRGGGEVETEVEVEEERETGEGQEGGKGEGEAEGEEEEEVWAEVLEGQEGEGEGGGGEEGVEELRGVWKETGAKEENGQRKGARGRGWFSFGDLGRRKGCNTGLRLEGFERVACAG